MSPDSIDQLPALLTGFSRGLRHRGPDDCGFLTWAGGPFSLGRDASAVHPGTLALVHRRLSIVDLSERGWQPMVDATEQFAIVLNGEVYNYPELRKELEEQGVRFRSGTDTEVLLNLLIRNGMGALRRVIGMFAFAFLDTRRCRLFLARDPFGIKPLFFSCRQGRVAFSSELRPLLDLDPASSRAIEPTALFDYLRHAVTDHGELTPVAGIRQLLPAHSIEIDTKTGSVSSAKRYWAPSVSARHSTTVEAAADELRHLFAQSIRLHLRADVPVAATLSGGIDSSAIVASIHKIQGPESLAVFSYIADDAAICEERYVDAAASAVGVTPRKIHLDPERLSQDLDSLILTQEQPFTTTSIWAQRCVFGRVHDDGFKVVLDGQGADELFGGYPVFRGARLASMIRRGRYLEAIRFLHSMPESSGGPLLRACGSLLPARVQGLARQLMRRPTVPSWMSQPWVERHAAASSRPFVPGDADTDLKAQLYDATVATSLPMLLRYADRNAMAVSLENRVPFLTTALADFALSLPDALLIDEEGTTKKILRSAMKGLVPDVILNRRDKIGFLTPEARWFSQSAGFRAQLAAAAAQPLPPCFAPAFRARLMAVADGRAPYGPEMWRAWNAIRWAQLLRLEFPG